MSPAAGAAPDGPLVTVVVRSMDRPLLRKALASLAAQDYPAIEILVIDATGGRHGPLPALRLAAGHSMRLVTNGQRLPRPQAADLGLASAAGEWITFLDDDDTCEPAHIAGLVAAARARPEALVVYGCGRLFDPDGRLDQLFGRPFNRALLYFGPLFYWQASLIRTRVRDLGCRFDPMFDVCEDRDFLAQVAAHGDFAFVEDLATFNFRADLGTSGTGTGANRDHARVARFEQLLRAKWAGDSAWHSERVFAKCRRGARALNAGDLPLAQREFASAHTEYPGDPNALHGLARVALVQGDRAQAEKLVRKAIAVNPRIRAFHATLAATGARPDAAQPGQSPASGPSPAVSRMAPCPCGSGQKYKACCGKAGAPRLEPDDEVTRLCVQAKDALAAGDAQGAFQTLQRAAAIRCDGYVYGLLEACCTKLAEPVATASLWSAVQRRCAPIDPGGTPTRLVVVGKSDDQRDAVRAMNEAGIVCDEGRCRFAASLDDAPRDPGSWVVFASPGDVPEDGVANPAPEDGVGNRSPDRAIVLTRQDGPEPLLRALSRIAEGWPLARLSYLAVNL